MGQQEKAQMYNALKDAGVPLDKHYRNYSEDELRPAYARLLELQAEKAAAELAEQSAQQGDQAAQERLDAALDEPAPAGFFGFAEPDADVPTAGDDFPAAPAASPYGKDEVVESTVPVRERDPEEFAGQRQNTNPDALEPIRVDEQGRTWFQEEVRKPAYPKPRGRRKLQYADTGTKTVRAKQGDYTETFEVPGDQKVMSEVRITLPSFQVGIYSDPRFPFKIHTYNGINGFDYDDVQKFYGGAELVPADVKRMYVSNVLCYDIRTTIRAIEQEARHLELQNRI